MIKTKTVLILGAGASNAYGFPLGQELLYKVCAIDPDGPAALLVEKAGYDADLLSEFLNTRVRQSARSTETVSFFVL